MTSFRIRPRFSVISELPQEEILESMKQELKKEECECIGVVIPGHATVKIHPNNIHFWSPQLDLSLEDEDKGTLIRGLYGPNPSVWSLFAFGYLVIGILFMFIIIIGFSAVSLNEDTYVLWGLPILIGLAIGIYLLSQLGQKIGAEQTFTLHHFIEKVLEQKVGIN